MAEALSTAFVEIALKGLSAVQSGINSVVSQVRSLSGLSVNVDSKSIDEMRGKLLGLTEALASLRTRAASLRLSLDSARTGSEADAIKAKLKAVNQEIKTLGAKEKPIRVALQGAETVQARVDALKKKLDEVRQVRLDALSSGFTTVTSTATRAFGVMSAGIVGLIRSASPRTFDDFSFAIFRVSVQLAAVFVPLVKEVTGWIGRLADHLRGLSAEQQASLLHWTKVALAVTGVLAILPRLLSVFSAGVAVVKGFAAAMSFLGAASPLGWIALAVAGFGALVAILDGASPVAAQLGAIWEQVSGVLGRVWDALSPLLSALGGVLLSVLSAVLSAVSALLPVIEGLVAGFLAYKAALVLTAAWNAVAAATSLGLAGAMAVAAGAVRAVGAALTTAFLTNPIGLAIAGIVAVVVALKTAFQETTQSVEEMANKVLTLDAAIKRLKEGGKASRQDIKELPSALQQELKAAQNDPKKLKEITDREIKKRQEALKQQGDTEQRSLQIQKVLEAGNITEDKLKDANFLQRWAVKIMTSKANPLGGAFNEQVTGRIRQEQLKNLGLREEDLPSKEELGKRELPQDLIIKVSELARKQGLTTEKELETLKAIQEGRTEGKTGVEPRPQQPQLMPIIEAWRKAQQSVVPSLEQRREQEMLKNAQEQTRTQQKIEQNTRPKEEAPPRIPG